MKNITLRPAELERGFSQLAALFSLDGTKITFQELADKHGVAVIPENFVRLHNLLGDLERVTEYSSKARAVSEAHSFLDQITRQEKISI